MRFTNFDRSYQVMRYLDGTEKTEEYLCTELTGREHTTCLLVRVTDSVLAKHLILFLEEKIKDQEFTDYRECFQVDGALIAVFRYSCEQNLAERLQTECCGRRERAEIARSLLERLLLLNPPPYFAWNGLEPSQITVSRSLEVHLNYHLKNLEKFEDCSFQDVGHQLQNVFQMLFEEEQKKQLYPLLGEYMRRLGTTTEWTYHQLYQDFFPVYKALVHENYQEQLPKTFWFRVWERIKKFLKICKKILAVVILVAAVIYVVRSIQDDSASQVVNQIVNQIGELTIESREMPEQESGE